MKDPKELMNEFCEYVTDKRKSLFDKRENAFYLYYNSLAALLSHAITEIEDEKVREQTLEIVLSSVRNFVSTKKNNSIN